MLNLPQFLLLSGDRAATYAFAEELLSRTDQVVAIDFSDPVLNSAIALFYDDDPMDARLGNLNDPAFWIKNIPLSDHISLAEWIIRHKAYLRTTLGTDILGRIFVQQYKDNAWEESFPHTIIRDFDEPADMIPIAKAHGVDSCVVVNLGPLTPNSINLGPLTPGGSRVVWTAATDPVAQVDLLLNDLRATRRSVA